ncbi:MAG: hypothetical protein DI533_17685 [Cereibacter sphaeroides]|uniref:SPOR domain-containing protein n=1 Tax=Cereibacter sphaeroides TaxID=1063 RepID=A0A2W5RYZ6_CERSP|nr:MAG: hypothetical protein DI533_17685 [Cereibacter sphaeroides]
MRLIIGAAAIFVALGGALPAHAQSVRDISGPREFPPASFKGPQYVDSGGCVFLRAGVDGKVIWVPRVNAQKKVLCGYPPTLIAKATPPAPADTVVIAMAEPEPTAPVIKVAKPRVEPVGKPVKAKGVKPQSNEYVDVPRAGSQPGTLRCPARAPVATRVPLRGGGSVILCLARSGLLDEQASIATMSVAPTKASSNTTLVCPREAPVAQRVPMRAGGTTTLCTVGDGGVQVLAMPKARVAQTKPRPVETRATRIAIPLPDPVLPNPMLVEPVVPKGYKLAWNDGRLNANRARGTAAGQFAQDMIWTQETPARLVTREQQLKRLALATKNETGVRVSTKGQPAKGSYVQVGSFGKPANAEAARARLAALGLPVARVRAKGGMQPVLAGPFDSVDEARLALNVARRGGFPDAALR